MLIELKPINTKSILDCSDEEIATHNKENEEILGRIGSIPNYQCLMVCKYQDVLNNNQKMEIRHQFLADVYEVEEIFGLYNGVDLFIDEDNYLCMMIYGDSYVYEEESCIVTLSVTILPFDENHNFIDLSAVLLNSGGLKIAEEQFTPKAKMN